MVKITGLLSFVFVLLSSSLAAAANAEHKLLKMNLNEIAFEALNVAIDEQKYSADPFYLKGEWPTKIESTMVPALVGVGKMFGHESEATAFTTASVINVLAQIYLENPNLKNQYPIAQIPNSMAAGIKSFERYKEGSTYNFYPAMIDKGVKVRRPIDMTLFPLWFGFTNIPNDADTTSAVLAALAFNARIHNQSFSISEEGLRDFSQFRDVNRKAMFFNRSNHLENSGGFMTWLYDENNPAMPRFYFATSTKGERIPFNRNDVDCVVNANVLKLLALTKNTNLEGHRESCQMLNTLIERDEHKDCGVYYPNTLNLSFAIANAEKAGETCITEKSHHLMVDKILAMQQADGSWMNDGNIWQDQTLTTAFAVYSLLHYANPREDRVHSALVYGVHWLLKNSRLQNGKLTWDADHFFTATALARSLIMWQSKAYTNAIVASVLLKMQREFPSYTTGKYLSLKF